MNKERQNLLFQEICDNYGVKFHEDKSSNNRSACTFEDIYIGVYDDLELRLISFFHELGHIDDMQKKRLPTVENSPYYHFYEASAWKTGLKIANSLGFNFSDSSIKWAKKQLKTYFKINPPNSEKTDIKFYKEAKEYAFSEIYTDK